MPPLITGIHHVTAFAKDPRENHDFYTRVLGLRLVKKTVNFDDPTTYHLYFGDESGRPGTLLTHFPHPNAKAGVHGSPEILETVLRVPAGALGYWRERFGSLGVGITEQGDADQAEPGESRIAFEDPHGMRFVLVESDDSELASGFTGSGVAAEFAITGVDGMIVHVPDVERTASFLEQALGFARSGSAEGGLNLVLGAGDSGQRLRLVEAPESSAARMGAGTVHHVAWRVPDLEAQERVADRVREWGVAVTPVMDRQYFRSIYFRVPGGIIFEVATDGPGFDVDEPAGHLGAALKLPPQYEHRRSELESVLVPLGNL